MAVVNIFFVIKIMRKGDQTSIHVARVNWIPLSTRALFFLTLPIGCTVDQVPFNLLYRHLHFSKRGLSHTRTVSMLES